MPAETHDDCPTCDGTGTHEYSTDHLDSRGEHYTREHTEPCGDCDGEGRVWVEVAT